MKRAAKNRIQMPLLGNSNMLPIQKPERQPQEQPNQQVQVLSVLASQPPLQLAGCPQPQPQPQPQSQLQQQPQHLSHKQPQLQLPGEQQSASQRMTSNIALDTVICSVQSESRHGSESYQDVAVACDNNCATEAPSHMQQSSAHSAVVDSAVVQTGASQDAPEAPAAESRQSNIPQDFTAQGDSETQYGKESKGSKAEPSSLRSQDSKRKDRYRQSLLRACMKGTKVSMRQAKGRKQGPVRRSQRIIAKESL